MKCKDFLAAHESKSAWQRWRARRHSVTCASCAAIATAADELRRELRQIEPLASALRETWIRAAGKGVPEPVAPPQRTLPIRHIAFFGAIAALVLAAIGLLIWNSARPAAAPSLVAVHTVTQPATLPRAENESSNELKELLSRMDALQQEMQATVKQAELLDARRHVDQMIATYSRW